jgi:hypothetical protein
MVMLTWRRTLLEKVASQRGVITLRQLRESGCDRRTVDRLIAAGEYRAVLPGVFLSAAWPLGREQVKIAACARNPSAVLAFTTAGQEWGLRKMVDERVHVLVPHGASPIMDGVVVHRCRRIDPHDVVARGELLRVTSVARTLFDVGAVIGVSGVRSALENALDRELVALDEVAECVQRLYHRRRPGSRQIQHVLKSKGEWSAAVQSDLESRVLRAIERVGLPSPSIQHAVPLSDGTSVRFDFAWPRFKVALEVDHSFWHAGSAESRSDKRRDRRVAALGWVTLRITEDDVRTGLDACMADVRAALDARGN